MQNQSQHQTYNMSVTAKKGCNSVVDTKSFVKFNTGRNKTSDDTKLVNEHNISYKV